jgi:DNA-binding transcriptional regulator YhcF (GntR family)
VRREAAQSLAVDIAVDRDAEIPIGVQLAWALRTRIRAGALTPGDRLPGLRDVAEATGVNVNTVRTVYQRLEQEGLIDSQQGSGTFVASTPRHSSAVTTIAADAAREARETGVDPRDVAAALYVSPGASTAASPANEATERRRLLREQIEALERTLVELEVKHPGVAPPATTAHPRENAGPALLGATELEQVRAVLLRRLSTVQTAIDDIAADEIPDTEQQLEPTPASKRVTKARQTMRAAPEGA